MEVKKSVDKGVRNAKFRNKTTKRTNNALVCPKGWARENTYQQAFTLLRACYSWLSDVQDWLGDFVSDLVCCACTGVCLSACEPLISTKHMLLNTGKQQPVDSALLPACQRERKVCVDMCECVKCVFAHIKERFALGWLLYRHPHTHIHTHTLLLLLLYIYIYIERQRRSQETLYECTDVHLQLRTAQQKLVLLAPLDGARLQEMISDSTAWRLTQPLYSPLSETCADFAQWLLLHRHQRDSFQVRSLKTSLS